MQSSNSEPTNPLGLNLDFMFGRGYLWANRERLSDWITLEKLRMEIPDLAFPFDARGGLDRFRNTRCLVREIELGISEVGLGDLLDRKSTRLNSSHVRISYAVFCLKKKKICTFPTAGITFYTHITYETSFPAGCKSHCTPAHLFPLCRCMLHLFHSITICRNQPTRP